MWIHMMEDTSTIDTLFYDFFGLARGLEVSFNCLVEVLNSLRAVVLAHALAQVFKVGFNLSVIK